MTKDAETIFHAQTVWEPEGESPWLVVFDFAEIDGRDECVGVSIRSYEGGDAFTPADAQGALESAKHAAGGALPLKTVTTRLLHQVPFATLLANTRPMIAEQWRRARAILTDGLKPTAGTPAETAKTIVVSKRGPGRRPSYKPGDLEKVAGIYVDAWTRHQNPTAEVAKRFPIPDATTDLQKRRRATKLVMAARRAGLLDPTERGKAGGIPSHYLTPDRAIPNPPAPTEGSGHDETH